MAYGNYAPFYRGGYFNPMQTPTMPPMADNQNQFAPLFQTPAQPNSAPMQSPIAPPTPTNDMIWVLGEVEAQSYPVAPNNTVTLWDKNQKTFYVKTANAQGMPSMQTYDFTERTEIAPKSSAEHECKCGDKFIPKTELTVINQKFEDISGKMLEIEAKLNDLSVKPTTKNTKKTEE
jgi:hypothetical protein